jgi:hypothetical protein
MPNRGPNFKKTNSIALRLSPSSSNRNSNSDDRGKKYPPRDDNSKTIGGSKRQRKNDVSNLNTGSDRTNKVHKTVTFLSHESNTATTSKLHTFNANKANVKSVCIGYLSMKGSGEAVLLPELPIKRKVIKGKGARKDEMLLW